MSGRLHAIRPGPHVTIQDLGRHGYQRFGVTEGGVMDRSSHCIGAALLGQPPMHASLEMVGMGGIFRSGAESVHVVVTGAPMPIVVGSRKHSAGRVVHLPPNTEFEVGSSDQGVFGYLSVGGGIEVASIMGSRSTHLRAGFGGLNGHPIAPGDAIPLGPARDIALVAYPLPTWDTGTFRFVWGLHADLFSPAARALLAEEDFEVTAHRDRMGMRLAAPQLLDAPASLSLPSSAVVEGDIQVPGDGHPVVLLADRQPTGGYPRIATLIQADRDRFVQQSSGSCVRFEEVSLDEATDLLLEYRVGLAGLAGLASPASSTPAALWQQNLISGFTVGEQEAD